MLEITWETSSITPIGDKLGRIVKKLTASQGIKLHTPFLRHSGMNVEDVLNIIDGKLLTPAADLTGEINGGCGADLMSDVLASIQPQAVLLTGLCNPQVVRTALMADVTAIILVRGKNPPQETIDLAVSENIPLISSPYGMFELCGRLYQSGMRSLEMPVNTGCDGNA